jgi:ABC-type Fe3+ transport system substrate-binding protein
MISYRSNAKTLGITVFAFFVLCLPRIAATASADPAAKYYEAAKKEGKLVIYGLGPPFLGPINDAFKKRYPGILIEAFDESGRETTERIIAEQKTGRGIGDIVIAGSGTHIRLGDLGFLEAYQSPQKSEMIPELVPQEGFTSPFRATIHSIGINTKLVPPTDEPKLWTDVLHPKFKDKMASEDPRGGGSGGGLIASLEMAFGVEFLHKLAAQNIFFDRNSGTVMAGLVRGEHALFLSASHDDMIVARKNGAPVKFLKPKDGTRANGNFQSIIKNPPHPNAAKLWLEWSLSQEGQEMVGKVGLVPARKGIATAEPEADLTGVKLLPVPQVRQDVTYLKERTKRYEDIFIKKK